jgi:outer membrane receptor protein involved in Fe transport
VADAEILAFRPVAGQKGPGAAVGSVYASPAGRFALPGLTPGTYVIQVRAAGYLPYAVREKLGAGSRLTVEYFVERRSYDPYETVVRTRTERKEVASYQVTLPEIQKIPGTQGDAIRSVQNMPGVARASFGGGALIVRGASPRDTRVYLEGHEIPQLFHFFGLTSVFNSDILSDIVFVPGNFSVQYGRATGGIIDVYTRAGSRDRWHGYLDIDLWDLGMLVEGPVGKGSIVLAARRSHIDAVLGLLPKDTLGVGLTLAPAYYDYQAMFDYPVLGGKLKIMAFGSDDRVKLLFDSPTGIDLTAKELTSTTLFHRALAAYSRKRDRGELKLSVSTGYQEIDTAISDALQFNLKVLRTNWRAQYAHEVHRTLTVAAGLDGEYSHAWLEFLIPSFGNEGEIPTPIASREKVRGTFSGGVYSQALYLEATWKPTKRLTIVPGLRGDFLKTLTLKGYVFDPRISARYQLPRKLAVTAAVGLFHQEPFFSDLVTSTGGNPSIRHERTMHASAGLAWQAREGLSLELTGFYKHLWRRVAPSSQLIWLEDRVTPENLANHGKGRIYGGELLIKKKPDRDCPRFLKLEKCFGWVSYTLMRSERQDGPGKAWRLFDFDQTHILTIILSGAWKKGWEFGFRFRLASGNPTTVLSGGIYDADTDAYIGIPGTRNAERLPLFHQLDLRVDKKWVFKKWMLSLYLDIQNVYNYRASEFVQYNFNYTQRGYVSGLPIIPSIGIKGEF